MQAAYRKVLGDTLNYNCECLMSLCIPPTATVTSGCYGTFAGNISYNSTESPGDAESPSMSHSNNIIAQAEEDHGGICGCTNLL